MKKICVFVLSLLLISSPALHSSVQEPKEETTQYNQENNDEFDTLIDDAITNGVVKEEIEFPKPSKFETLVRKIGVTFFLKPYVYAVTKYRATKKFVTHYTCAFAKAMARMLGRKEKDQIEKTDES